MVAKKEQGPALVRVRALWELAEVSRGTEFSAPDDEWLRARVAAGYLEVINGGGTDPGQDVPAGPNQGGAV